MPPMSPMFLYLLRSRVFGSAASALEQIERRQDCILRDEPSGDDLGAVPANGCSERRRPAVLVHQNGGGRARLEDGAAIGDVLITEYPRRRSLEHGQVELAVSVQIAELRSPLGAVRILDDESEIKDANE